MACLGREVKSHAIILLLSCELYHENYLYFLSIFSNLLVDLRIVQDEPDKMERRV
jgi:hypothetical protein